MTLTEIHEYLLKFNNTWLDFPFGDEVAVYKIGHSENGKDKMFALIAKNSKPVQISLRCDPILAEKLRADYETVLPGYHLNKKHWNTIIVTGQIPDEELKGFMRLSYDLVNGG
jgi:predicted DNA-binding protein (MmcQ/YjbR family)